MSTCGLRVVRSVPLEVVDKSESEIHGVPGCADRVTFQILPIGTVGCIDLKCIVRAIVLSTVATVGIIAQRDNDGLIRDQLGLTTVNPRVCNFADID